jgi:hypothetical protein
MRAVVLLAVAAVLALAGTASAAAPPGAPHVRVARASDMADHPDVIREWWTLHLLRPGSTQDLAVTVIRSDREIGVAVGAGRPFVAAFAIDATATTLRARGTQGTLVARLGRHSLSMRITGPVLSGALRLDDTRRGPAALGFRFGTGFSELGPTRPPTLNWAALAATGRARGTLRLPTGSVGVHGWLGHFEHGWGRFFIVDPVWEYWDEYVVHTAGGGASIVFGMNRTDTLVDGGIPNDATWIGVMATVGARDTTVCRPAVARSGWTIFGGTSIQHAQALTARCAGRTLRFRDGAPGASVADNDAPFALDFNAGRGTVNGHGIGLRRHPQHL